MYYRYNEDSVLIEKSKTLLTGNNVCSYEEDFDIELYKYVIALLDESKRIIYYTKLDKPISELTNLISQLNTKVNELNPSIDVNTCTLDELKNWYINLSKKNLENYFNTSTIESSCHGDVSKQYAISREKQLLLANMILITQMATQAGITYQASWNASGEPCTYDWTIAELQQLAFEIESIVRPKISEQQTIESNIKVCTTKDEILAIDITF
jgi:translation elongation factor EF-G